MSLFLQNEYFYGYKQSQRRDDDIAIVNAGFRVCLKEGASQVQEMALSFGGMAAKTVMATRTANAAIGL